MTLPPEIFSKVLKILDQPSKVTTTAVSREWRSYAYQTKTMWQDLVFTRARYRLSPATFSRVLSYSSGTLKSIRINQPVSFWCSQSVDCFKRYFNSLRTVFIEVETKYEDEMKIFTRLAEVLRRCRNLRNIILHNKLSQGSTRREVSMSSSFVETLFSEAEFEKLSTVSLKNVNLGSLEILERSTSNHLDELETFVWDDSYASRLALFHCNALHRFLGFNKKTIQTVNLRLNMYPSQDEAEEDPMAEVDAPFLTDLTLGQAFLNQDSLKFEAIVTKIKMPILSNLDLHFLPRMAELNDFFFKLSDQSPNLKSIKLRFYEGSRTGDHYREDQVVSSLRIALEVWKDLESFTLRDDGFAVTTRALLGAFSSSSSKDDPLPCPKLKELNLSSMQGEQVGEVISGAVKLVSTRLKAAAGSGADAGRSDSSRGISSTLNSAVVNEQSKKASPFSRAASNSGLSVPKSKSSGAFSTSPRPVSSGSTSSPLASTSNPQVSKSAISKIQGPAFEPIETTTSVPFRALSSLHLPRVDFQSVDQKALEWLRAKLDVVAFSAPQPSKKPAGSGTNSRGERIWAANG